LSGDVNELSDRMGFKGSRVRIPPSRPSNLFVLRNWAALTLGWRLGRRVALFAKLFVPAGLR